MGKARSRTVKHGETKLGIWECFTVAAIASFICFGIFSAGGAVKRSTMQQEAIDRGFAEYVSLPDGASHFRWKDIDTYRERPKLIDVDCPECYGSGELYPFVMLFDGKKLFSKEPRDCHRCGGSGTLLKEESK